MKYKAGQLNNGKWAVFTGRKYFPNTVCDSENDAHIQACEMSARWYQDKMDECAREWEKAHRKNGKRNHYEDGATSENIKNFSDDWSGVIC